MIPENQNKVLDTQEIEELQSDLEGLKTELEDMKTNLEQNLQEASPNPPLEPSEDLKKSEKVQSVAESSSSSLKSSDLENEIEFGLKSHAIDDACMCDDQKIGNIRGQTLNSMFV